MAVCTAATMEQSRDREGAMEPMNCQNIEQ
jgi:hypothetical protein